MSGTAFLGPTVVRHKNARIFYKSPDNFAGYFPRSNTDSLEEGGFIMEKQLGFLQSLVLSIKNKEPESLGPAG